MLTWVLIKGYASKAGQVLGKQWKLVAVAILIAVSATALYACGWEQQKGSVARDKVREARAEVRVLQAKAVKAAIDVQNSNQEAAQRAKEVDDAVEQSGDWGSGAVPDSVRAELCRTLDCGKAG